MNAKCSNSRLNIISGKAMNLGLLKIRYVVPLSLIHKFYRLQTQIQNIEGLRAVLSSLNV